MNFKATFCDPFKPNIIEIGNVEKNKIMELFEKIPWSEYLTKMKTAKEDEIYYSPSLGVENKDNRNGLSISAIDEQEWYIFYKRPKLVKKFFGLIKKMDNDYLTEIHVQTADEVKNYLKAFMENDLQFLESKIK